MPTASDLGTDKRFVHLFAEEYNFAKVDADHPGLFLL